MLTLVFLIGAADGFRCPDTGRIISLGDMPTIVSRRCREPDARSQRTEIRRNVRWEWRVINGRARQVPIESEDQVVVEEWTYDFGEHRFVRVLHFENDHLMAIAEGPYGSGS